MQRDCTTDSYSRRIFVYDAFWKANYVGFRWLLPGAWKLRLSVLLTPSLSECMVIAPNFSQGFSSSLPFHHFQQAKSVQNRNANDVVHDVSRLLLFSMYIITFTTNAVTHLWQHLLFHLFQNINKRYQEPLMQIAVAHGGTMLRLFSTWLSLVSPSARVHLWVSAICHLQPDRPSTFQTLTLYQIHSIPNHTE